MEQAGINSIKFYENKGLSITLDASDKITAISNTGRTIDFDECINQPQLEILLDESKNNDILFDYTINGTLLDISTESYNNLEFFLENIYGWIPEIDLKNGQKILLNDPFFGESEDLNINESHSYFLEIKPRVVSNNKPIYFA